MKIFSKLTLVLLNAGKLVVVLFLVAQQLYISIRFWIFLFVCL